MDISFLSDLTPADLDMPKKFTEFRDIQKEMGVFALYGQTGDPEDARRFHCMGVPPGGGKSAAGHLIGLLGSLKYATLTATRSLEDQQVKDGFDLVNVRGRANYECSDPRVLKEFARNEKNKGRTPTCSDGDDHGCGRCGPLGSCPYSQQVRRAKGHRSVLSNYQYWMNARAMNNMALEGVLESDLGEEEAPSTPIGMLICDECFPAGTLVSGRPIETLREGDLVNAWDEKTGNLIPSRILATSIRPTSKIVQVKFSDGTEIVTTENHPFWTMNGWVKAAYLGIGEVLCLKPQSSRPEERQVPAWVRVVGFEIHEQGSSNEFERLCPGGLVYNLEVENLHTYTANGIVVHNCHLIPNELSRFLGTWVSSYDLKRFGGDDISDAIKVGGGGDGSGEWGLIGPTWIGALGTVLGRVVMELVEMVDRVDAGGMESAAQAKARVRRSAAYRRLDKLRGNLERVVTLGDDNNWLWRYQGTGIAFDCIWPSRYAERYLWSGVPKIVLMSATLRPKSLDMSGVKRAERWFKEWPRVFPKELSPVYWVPTCRMGYKVAEDEKLKTVRRLDEMAKLWEGRRGIVHTPSYQLAEWLFEHSSYSKRMVLNRAGGEDAAKAAKKYRETPGAILVSPSFHTGHDFADEACEWQYIPKLPFPSKGDAVIQARCESDPTYYASETMQRLVQTCFRGTRHDRDRCTTVIADDMVKGFRHYASEAAPKWFKILERATVPGPGR